LEGGNGADVYVYDWGDGDDVISDIQGGDKILFGEGIAFDDLEFIEDDSDLTIEYMKHDGLKLILKNHFGPKINRIEILKFYDGTTQELEAITVN